MRQPCIRMLSKRTWGCNIAQHGDVLLIQEHKKNLATHRKGQ